MKNRYNLYKVKHIKGMLIYKDIDNVLAYNIIEAEDEFEIRDKLQTGDEYVITIEKT